MPMHFLLADAGGKDMKAKLCLMLATVAVAGGCTKSSSLRTSQDTAIIQTSAAPICGQTGATRTAQMQAAIETIRAGYDRYVIYDARSANNVNIVQMPSSYQTVGTVNTFGNSARINATTTYQPGLIVPVGAHDAGLAIKMFRDGDSGSEQAVSARDVLGPDWPKLVKNGVHTCAG